jgi:succinylglutamate desuccinylase
VKSLRYEGWQSIGRWAKTAQSRAWPAPWGYSTLDNYLTHLLNGRTDQPWPAALPCGARVSVIGEGLMAIEPAAPAFDVFISSGIHGNETAPIELAAKLLQEMLDGEVAPKARLLFAFGNPEAIRRNERYLDDDLNRLFGKSVEQTGNGPAAQRARVLEGAAKQFFVGGGDRWRIHYDLHTAIRGSQIEKFAIYPFPHDAPVDAAELGRLSACGISAVLLQSKPSPTFSYFTRQHCGAHGFTLELGKARPFGQNQAVNLDLLEQELRRLIAGEARRYKVSPSAPTLFRVAREVTKQYESFTLHLDEAVENFTALPQGYVLADDGPTQFIVTEPDARIVFPNAKVKVGLRAGLLVVPATL